MSQSSRRLRLAGPAEPVPDDRVPVARRLLDRLAPVEPVLVNQALTDSGGPDLIVKGPAWQEVEALESDPRYLIGRLHQALSALLQADLPPMGAVDELLSDAIEDAVAYRTARWLACPCSEGCDRCQPDRRRSAEYEGLFGQLGLIGDWPPPPPRLVVSR